MSRIIPWVIAAACAASSVGLWLSRPDAEQPPDGGAEVNGVTPPPPSDAAPTGRQAADLALCRRCVEHLSRTRALLERCRDERGGGDSEGELSEAARTCIELPEVRRLVDAQVGEALTRRSEEESRRRELVREREEAAVRELLVETLGLSDGESRWLTEYVCTVRELRQQALGDIAPGGPSSAETVERIRVEREEHLDDLEEYLGSERYARLRDVGGIGLLADVLRCGEESNSPPP